MTTPTLYEWIGGMPVLARLIARFYERVATDPLLAPVFAHMPADHPQHVALFWRKSRAAPPNTPRGLGGTRTWWLSI